MNNNHEKRAGFGNANLNALLGGPKPSGGGRGVGGGSAGVAGPRPVGMTLLGVAKARRSPPPHLAAARAAGGWEATAPRPAPDARQDHHHRHQARGAQAGEPAVH